MLMKRMIKMTVIAKMKMVATNMMMKMMMKKKMMIKVANQCPNNRETTKNEVAM